MINFFLIVGVGMCVLVLFCLYVIRNRIFPIISAATVAGQIKCDSINPRIQAFHLCPPEMAVAA